MAKRIKIENKIQIAGERRQSQLTNQITEDCRPQQILRYEEVYLRTCLKTLSEDKARLALIIFCHNSRVENTGKMSG